MKESKRKLLPTKDGSHTLLLPDLDITYHSRHGAVAESMHVFINAGLHYAWQKGFQNVRILEMGFGTGLNALLTLAETQKGFQNVYYTALELYPLTVKEAEALNYVELLPAHERDFKMLHECNWGEYVKITERFTLRKERSDLLQYESAQLFDVIYYDAFAPSAQPELWTESVFKKLYNLLQAAGILVTYCAKGDVRRALLAAGFSVAKLQGPPGKREMLRAEKVDN